MAEVQVHWIGEKRFVGVDSTQHSVVLSGGDDIGVKPSEGLLIALAACSGYDVVEIIQKQRITLSKLEIKVTGQQLPEPPWSYTHIHLSYRVVAPGLTQEKLERAIDLSLNKYCSVRTSLSPNIQVTTEGSVE